MPYVVQSVAKLGCVEPATVGACEVHRADAAMTLSLTTVDSMLVGVTQVGVNKTAGTFFRLLMVALESVAVPFAIPAGT